MIDFDKNDAWYMFKRELKFNDKSRYYNRIPRIMFLLGKGCRMNVDSITYHSILGRFQELEYLFGLQKERKYFPSLRYTSIRLLWEHGILRMLMSRN